MSRAALPAALSALVFAGVACQRSSPKPARPVVSQTFAPEVPPPITRHRPATVHVKLDARPQTIELAPGIHYRAWTFSGHVPGPMIRARVGDTLEVTLTNHDPSGMPHDIDFHAVQGPGGGSAKTTVTPGHTVTASFPLKVPGLFVYHCAVQPMAEHIANGMYGLLLVEPRGGLPKAQEAFYVMQGEFYTSAPVPGRSDQTVTYSRADGLAENPRYVVFNGASGALLGDHALRVHPGDRVRLFFGNAGPNHISSLHVVGTVMDRLYREGGLVDPPSHGIQTTLVPPGGAVVVDFIPALPGAYTLVDHAMFRMQKGAMGQFIATPKAPAP